MPLRNSFILGILVVLTLLFAHYATGGGLASLKRLAALTPQLTLTWGYRQDPVNVLNSAAPVMAWSVPGATRKDGVGDRLLTALGDVATVEREGSSALISAQLPSLFAPLALQETVTVSRSAVDRHLEAPLPEQPALTDDALVLIINTHAGETYSLTDRKDRLEQGQGGVVLVAAALQEALEGNYGIKTLRSDLIHDKNYNSAYAESGKTVTKLLAEAPRVRMVFDIHRDAGKTREQSFISIDGAKVASLLFVVSSRNEANLDFAKKLSENINETYPGLSLGVRVKDSNYNQQLHPQMALVEIGSTKNTLEEAVRSAVLLAKVIAEMIDNEREI
jgi:stage II sporulation protein P